MRKIVAIGLAGALATASIGTTTSSAEASNVGAFVVGALVGAGVVALVHHYPPFTTTRAYGYAPVYAGSDHLGWCETHYRSYNPATDSFIGYDGHAHRCISPY